MSSLLLSCLFLLASGSYTSFFSSVLHRSGKDPPRVALHERVVDEESVKLALRQHHSAGYRYLVCLVISSRLSYDLSNCPRDATKIDRVARDGPFLGGTGPRHEFISCRAVRVVTEIFSLRPFTQLSLLLINAFPLRSAYTVRIKGTVFGIPLFHSLCSSITFIPSETHYTHTHMRARAYTHYIHTHKRMYVYTESQL